MPAEILFTNHIAGMVDNGNTFMMIDGDGCGSPEHRTFTRPRVHTVPKTFTRIRMELDRVLQRLHGNHSTLQSTEVLEKCNPSRSISIEYPQKKLSKVTLSNQGFFDINRNYTPALYLHPIQQGRFRADISLNAFPQEEDIVVQIHSYQLHICRSQIKKDKKGKIETILNLCGVIDLPIYIDSSTLQFAINNENKLMIECFTKSLLQIHKQHKSQSQNLIFQSPQSTHRKLTDNSLPVCEAFRNRAYTR